VAGATTQALTAGQLPAFGGATGVTTGGVPLPTSQPSLALTQSLVTQGFFPQSNGTPAQGPIVGQVLTYAGSTIPAGQIAANGQQLSVAQNSALFSVLGNTYGGNFPTTFAAPNLSGRAATEAGAAPGLTPQSLGQPEGAESTVLSLANLPPQPLRLPNGAMSVLGGGQPFNVQDPTLGLHYIIAEQGVFPTATGLCPMASRSSAKSVSSRARPRPLAGHSRMASCCRSRKTPRFSRCSARLMAAMVSSISRCQT
jgi:microcystin-dependent protein